tara:strand:- start:8699 stop:9118 length:420 start_codon:yes stop_codon:yes gene_type:complete
MTVTHGSLTVNGKNGLAVVKPPELHVKRTHFPGLRGDSEIVLGTGGAQIDVPMWIYNSYTTRAKLQDFEDEMRGHVGTNATLTVTLDSETETYTDCTFVGFEPMPLPGQQHASPLKDHAGTVDGGWFINGMLHFYQVTG